MAEKVRKRLELDKSIEDKPLSKLMQLAGCLTDICGKCISTWEADDGWVAWFGDATKIYVATIPPCLTIEDAVEQAFKRKLKALKTHLRLIEEWWEKPWLIDDLDVLDGRTAPEYPE